MVPHALLLNFADLRDPEMASAAIASALLAGAAGWFAASRLYLSGSLRIAAAGIGAASIVITCIPSMTIFGSLGAGVVALLVIQNVIAGKTFVVIATAVGCALVAWVGCLAIFATPAVVRAATRESRNP